jgi:hypothetical protein
MTRLAEPAEPRVSNDHGSDTSPPHFQRLRVLAVSGGVSFVAVVQSTDLTHRHDWPDFWRLNRARLRRVFSQRQAA